MAFLSSPGVGRLAREGRTGLTPPLHNVNPMASGAPRHEGNVNAVGLLR